MKIEILESLAVSWLRHVKDCQVTQQGWKVSPFWTLRNEAELKAIAAKAEKYFKRHGIILNLSKLKQVLNQGEVDALGISLSKGRARTIIAIDSAFHGGGLNYSRGKGDETVRRVTLKLLRAALLLRGYFNISHGKIIFLAPRVQTSKLIPLKNAIQLLRDFIRRSNLDFSIDLYENDQFKTQFWSPLQAKRDEIKDSGELGIRALQLAEIAENQKMTTELPQRIGTHVRTSMSALLQTRSLSKLTLRHLQNYNYCKRKFGLKYPMLKRASAARSFSGKSRYYSRAVNGFLICNHWVTGMEKKFDAWQAKRY